MFKSYIVAVCQAEMIHTRSGGDERIKENAARNLKRYCDLIDSIYGGGGTKTSAAMPKLVTFGEFAITGPYAPAEPQQRVMNKKEIIQRLAIRIPGEETDVLAKKAIEHDTYIAAANLEFDPDWPDFFFNCGFIINPRGKIILKYRKTLTNNTAELSASVHDYLREYKNPITQKPDPFPVVDTAIGRLAVMVCADQRAVEIPRVYSMKGAEVILHLTSSGTWSPRVGGPTGIIEARTRTRASDNCVYWIESNWGPVLESIVPRGVMDGYSRVYDYNGGLLAIAPDSNEYIVRAVIDIDAVRRLRGHFFNNLSLIRTELYAPFYNKPIYPANTYLDPGPPGDHLDDRAMSYFAKAKENLSQLEDFYSEDSV
jgi:predicted amidohydrolase